MNKLEEVITIGDEENTVEVICKMYDDENLFNSCYDTVIDLAFGSSSEKIINAINLLFLYRSRSINLAEAFKIFNLKTYSYDKFKQINNLYNSIIYNDVLSSELLFLLIVDAVKYKKVLVDLVEHNNIDCSKIDMSIEDKISSFYKIIGLTTFHVKKYMQICFDLLLDDGLLLVDKELVLVFSRFYAWNYINNSNEFINNSLPKTNSQKELIWTLKEFVLNYDKDIKNSYVSKDFEIDSDIVNAKIIADNNLKKEITEEAYKKSVFYNLINHTTILRGNKVVFVSNFNNPNDRNKSTNMHPFGVGYEYPLDYLIDPIGYEITISFLLNGGKDEINC